MHTRKAIDADRVEAGERLRDKREAAKIAVTLMAHLLNCDPKTIDNYEKGRTKAGGAVEFAYDNIELLMTTRLGKRGSACDYVYGSQEPLPFPQHDYEDVIDLRDRFMVQADDKEPLRLYSNAS